MSNYYQFILPLMLNIGLLGTVVFSEAVTLSELEKYAHAYEEYPDSDSDDWINPDYTTFLESKVPSFGRRILQKIGWYSDETWWSPDFFVKLAKTRGPQDIAHHDKVLGTVVEPGKTKRFVIWANLFGAYHSLVRSLRSLCDQHILSEDLRILADDVCLIFNGHVVGNGAYALEILTLVWLLQDRNPGKVLYLKGEQEAKQRWHVRSLGKSIRIFCSRDENTLMPLLDNYFQSLPIALYIADVERKQAIGILPGHDKKNNNYSKFLGDFFEQLTVDTYTEYLMKTKIPTNEIVKLRVLVEGRYIWDTLKPTQPLVFDRHVNEYEPPSWIMTSSQTRTYRQWYRFFYDAYVILTVNTVHAKTRVEQAFGLSTLALVARDVRKQEGWAFRDCYQLTSGTRLGEICHV